MFGTNHLDVDNLLSIVDIDIVIVNSSVARTQSFNNIALNTIEVSSKYTYEKIIFYCFISLL